METVRTKRHIIKREDECYGASWSLSDEEDIRKDFLRIQNGSLNPEIFINRLHRCHEDQTVWIDKSRKYLEPLKVGYKKDLVVVEGLIRLAEYAAGKSSKLFSVYVIGTGDSDVSDKDFELEIEEVRFDIFDNGGYVQSRGSTNYWGLMFPRETQTINNPPIKESAIVDDMDPTKDQMLLRTVLPDDEEIEHVANEDVFSFNHVVYNSSV